MNCVPDELILNVDDVVVVQLFNYGSNTEWFKLGVNVTFGNSGRSWWKRYETINRT